MSKKISIDVNQQKFKLMLSYLAYTDLSKQCVSHIKELECPAEYIADMLRDLTDSIMTSYPEVKHKNSN